MSFFAELRRRNVIRMAGLYLIGSWLIVQVADTVLPMFGAPMWLPRSLVILLAIGFLPALAFAWIFELTPDGIKRDEEVEPGQSIAPKTAQRMNRLIVAALVLAVIYFGVDKFVFAPQRDAASVAQTSEPIRAPDAAPSLTDVVKKVTDKSIAVLPFENLSEDKANGFFADGIQDQILTSLAQIADLKVISRTSTQKYASRPENLSQIARELGVAHILEGSVQKSGNQVRINVQLIEADSDSHLWAKTYDRKLDDIFVMQSEVAQEIADSLQARLTGAERTALTTPPTENPAAYEVWLKARTLQLGSPYDEENNDRIVETLQRVVQLDPNFAAAWAHLASQGLWIYWSGFDASPERLAAARAALDRATALDPEAPEVQMTQAQYLYTGERDFKAASTILNRLKQRLPNDADIWFRAATAERRLDQFDESVADFARARSLNPNDARTLGEYGITLYALRRFNEAEQVLDAALELQPDDPSLLAMKLYNAWEMYGIEGGANLLASVQSDDVSILALRGTQALFERDYTAASGLFRRALAGKEQARSPIEFAGYLPGDVGLQLVLAFSEQRNDASATAKDLYRQVQSRARSVLATEQPNPNIAAAWHAALGWAEAGLGQRESSIRNAQRATELIPEAGDAFEGPTWVYYLAQTYALNGNADHAIPLLEHLLQIPSGVTREFLRLDPTWDAIRDDPRFQNLLKEAGHD
ncbi:MAG TPA: tetratricopeptide repeat protein [Dokdonella sp.]|uniref:TPR end-of-group domain-containing protein n=1 Tax=Dokdonella sp. TaxID=2291710 RepID=UPI002D804D1F|nr:tetratricopeptide repeat protein [Dokdonella sp.]HET9032302.1 tetratricopeptide repeat protein [Dokdonella sp.]